MLLKAVIKSCCVKQFFFYAQIKQYLWNRDWMKNLTFKSFIQSLIIHDKYFTLVFFTGIVIFRFSNFGKTHKLGLWKQTLINFSRRWWNIHYIKKIINSSHNNPKITTNFWCKPARIGSTLWNMKIYGWN